VLRTVVGAPVPWFWGLHYKIKFQLGRADCAGLNAALDRGGRCRLPGPGSPGRAVGNCEPVRVRLASEELIKYARFYWHGKKVVPMILSSNAVPYTIRAAGSSGQRAT
jgi:hypothetical protein